MKNINYKYYWIILIPVLFSACSKSFLEKPPVDSIVDVNFYQNDDQILAGTALLYSKVWHDYNDKASYNFGDFRAGTAYSAYNDHDNVHFTTTALTLENSAAWKSFFVVVGQSNLAIQNINKYAGSGVTPAIKKFAIAEARFMRALAYRYLVMNWGEVPIIQNNVALFSDTTIHRNTVNSIWRFITNEMRAAEQDLPETAIRVGRITKWSAEGMLARFYLTRAGVESDNGVRNQVYLDSAKYFAKRVIEQSGAKLLSSYYKLFLFPYDNNSESLFELQWVFSTYGTSNSVPSYFNYGAEIANGDGWGNDKGATLWMLGKYEGLMTNGRTDDQRLKATFMMPGASYPEITQTVKGVDQRLIFPYFNNDVNSDNIKKYVVGQAKDVGGLAGIQNYDNDTYMMRLAEVYLIYAEAELGNQATTSDPTALQYFNAVHTRAGLTPFAGPLTFDVIFNERIVEFAMEAMAWYDFVSLHYYNPEKAYIILNSQDRGYFKTVPDQFPNPNSWAFVKTPWANTDRTIDAHDGNFHIPLPASDVIAAPNLKKEPVDYYSK